MGASEFNAEIKFEKNEYYIGEKCNVTISVDNSNCKKDVRGLKLKLHRHY